MATPSRCILCSGTSFELVERTPKNAIFKMFFIQCEKCGGVVGVTEYFHVGTLLLNLGKKLGFDLTKAA
ncbi:MAG: hypothetical protein LH606_15660 [Cytophagaceae bacterium]|nr:hypothetical protein [Cytophagaceae bacterium]